MHSILLLSAVALFSLAVVAAAGPNGPIAGDGGVELFEVTYTKTQRGYVEREPDGEMRLELWAIIPPKSRLVGPKYQLTQLTIEPIADDTGRVVSEKRKWDAQTSEPKSVTVGKKTRTGAPFWLLQLDGPGRGATTLKRVKGSFTLAAGKEQELELNNLLALSGKPLPLPKGADCRVTPVVRTENKDIVVGLQITGVVDRVTYWTLGSSDPEVGFSRAPEREIPEGKELTLVARWASRLPADTTLYLTLFVPTASRTYAFDMRDIELP